MSFAQTPVRNEAARARGHWAWLDVIRGIAALLVCSGHLRAVLFVDFHESPSNVFWVQLFYGATALGHQAVMVFFVLSGFLVGGSVVRAGSRFSVRDYATARLSRLWTVLIPALLLTLGFDLVLQRVAPAVLDGALSDKWFPTPTAETYSASVSTFLANMFFLQTMVAPVYGSNSPLWSLTYEFWYYVLFPLIVWSFRATAARRLGFVAAAIALVYCLPVDLILGFVIWLFGVVAWRLSQSTRPAHPLSALAALVLFAGALLLSVLRPAPQLNGQMLDMVIGATFSLLLTCLIRQRKQPQLTGMVYKPLQLLSDVSYSLYANHYPCVLLVGVFCGTMHTQWRADATTLAIYFACLIALCAWTCLVWSVTERHTSVVRLWMRAASDQCVLALARVARR